MKVQVHENLAHMGYVNGELVHYTLYWASRIVKNLSGVARYDAMRRTLQEIIWDHFRVVSDRDNAIDRKGLTLLQDWVKREIPKLTNKQMVDGRQFVDHVEQLRQFVDAQAGR